MLPAPTLLRRYLGSHPELIDCARQLGGTVDTGKIRSILFKRPHILEKVTDEGLEMAGITREQLNKGEFEIDHIWPSTKNGLNHPCNYFITSRTCNRSWSGKISVEKCLHVGGHVSLMVLLFHFGFYTKAFLQGPHMEPLPVAAALS
jgi:hypothetical protein